MVYDHLARAGLINLPQFSSLDPATWKPGVNWFSVLGKGNTVDPGNSYSGDGLFIVNTNGGMLLSLGGSLQGVGANQITFISLNLSPNDMRLLDMKMDDGVPLTGSVWIEGYDVGAGMGNKVTSSNTHGTADCLTTNTGGDYIYINSDYLRGTPGNFSANCFFFKRPSF